MRAFRAHTACAVTDAWRSLRVAGHGHHGRVLRAARGPEEGRRRGRVPGLTAGPRVRHRGRLACRPPPAGTARGHHGQVPHALGEPVLARLGQCHISSQVWDQLRIRYRRPHCATVQWVPFTCIQKVDKQT